MRQSAFVRDVLLFPPNVRKAYVKQSCVPIPRDSQMYEFCVPTIVDATAENTANMVVVSIDNTPRVSNQQLKDILSYEVNGQAFMHDISFPFIAENRGSPMVSRPPAQKIRQLLSYAE